LSSDNEFGEEISKINFNQITAIHKKKKYTIGKGSQK
jgi:hypothetical protein